MWPTFPQGCSHNTVFTGTRVHCWTARWAVAGRCSYQRCPSAIHTGSQRETNTGSSQATVSYHTALMTLCPKPTHTFPLPSPFYFFLPLFLFLCLSVSLSLLLSSSLASNFKTISTTMGWKYCPFTYRNTSTSFQSPSVSRTHPSLFARLHRLLSLITGDDLGSGKST